MPAGPICINPTPNWWSVYGIASQPIVVDLLPLQGVITADFFAEVREANSIIPATVIDVDDDFAIDVHLELTVNSPLANLLCGYWCISVCLESMCGDGYYRFPRDSSTPSYCCVLVPFNASNTYDYTFCIPGNIVQESECGSPYEATVIVTMLSQTKRSSKPNGDPNDPGTFIPAGAVGSFELPLLTFYQDQ